MSSIIKKVQVSLGIPLCILIVVFYALGDITGIMVAVVEGSIVNAIGSIFIPFYGAVYTIIYLLS